MVAFGPFIDLEIKHFMRRVYLKHHRIVSHKIWDLTLDNDNLLSLVCSHSLEPITQQDRGSPVLERYAECWYDPSHHASPERKQRCHPW